jgi:molybdopterin-guanine dinucleotide biosynthesis protein A
MHSNPQWSDWLMENVHVVGVILAGGLSRRFGTDKCVALLGENPIIEWVIKRARHQVQALLLNANRAIETRSKIEHLSDHAPGEGPMAGIVGALKLADQRGFTHVAGGPAGARLRVVAADLLS